MSEDLFNEDVAGLERGESDPAFVVDLGAFEVLVDQQRLLTGDLLGYGRETA